MDDNHQMKSKLANSQASVMKRYNPGVKATSTFGHEDAPKNLVILTRNENEFMGEKVEIVATEVLSRYTSLYWKQNSLLSDHADYEKKIENEEAKSSNYSLENVDEETFNALWKRKTDEVKKRQSKKHREISRLIDSFLAVLFCLNAS